MPDDGVYFIEELIGKEVESAVVAFGVLRIKFIDGSSLEVDAPEISIKKVQVESGEES